MISTGEVPSCLVCDSVSSAIIETTSTMMDNRTDQWHFRKCMDCGMVYLSPRVLPEFLDEYYTDAYLPYRGAKAWGKYAHLVEQDQKKIDTKRLQTVQKYISNETKSILDIGCGKPSFLKLVQEQIRLNAIGLDFSDKGWKDNPDLYDKLDLRVGSIDDIQNGIKVDVITMWHYLEHDYNPSRTIELLSKFQKGTLLIIEVPNHDSYSRKKYKQHWAGYHSPRHTGLYTPQTMQKLLESNGWMIEDQYTHGTLDPYVLDWMSRMEIKSIDWTASMEAFFVNFVLGKLMRPRYFFDKYLNLGFMTTIARKT